MKAYQDMSRFLALLIGVFILVGFTAKADDLLVCNYDPVKRIVFKMPTTGVLIGATKVDLVTLKLDRATRNRFLPNAFIQELDEVSKSQNGIIYLGRSSTSEFAIETAIYVPTSKTAIIQSGEDFRVCSPQ